MYQALCNAEQVIQCNQPTCVAIHDNGDIYVGSADNFIYVFDQTGQPKKKYVGESCVEVGHLVYKVYSSREMCYMSLIVPNM